MAVRAVSVLFVAALLAAGCDLSQKKPEVGSPRSDGIPAADLPLNPSELPRSVMDTPADSRGGASVQIGGERSIRLFGPGISRKRQTRV